MYQVVVLIIFVIIGLAKTKESKSKRGQKRKAEDMAAGDGDDARDQRVKNRVCLVRPMETTIVLTGI